MAVAKHRSGGFIILILALAGAAITIVGGLIYGHVRSDRIVTDYVPVIEAAKEAKFEATVAHLWFEEIHFKEHGKDFKAVNVHLDRAQWYLNAMLDGGANERGVFVAIQDRDIRAGVEEAMARLETFRRTINMLLPGNAGSQPDSSGDRKLDDVYQGLVSQIDTLETALHGLIANERRTDHAVLWSILGMIAVTLVFLTFVIFRYDLTQRESLEELETVNLQLIEEVVRRTEAEKALKSVHDDLEGQIQARTVELRDIKTRFQNLVESSSDMIWEVDADGVYTYVSPKVRDILGFEPEEMVGLTPFRFMTPEVAEVVGAAFSEYVTDKAPFANLENMNLHKYGHEVILETSGVPIFDDDGTFKGYRGVDRDITQRKEAEVLLGKLSQAVEQSADMVFITDAEGTIEYVNATFERLSGYSAEESIGQNPRFLGTGDTPRSVYEDLWNTILSGDVWRHELRDRRKDGGTFWSSVTITPIKDASGEIANFVSTHRDITERKRAEEVTLQALRQTDIANKAKSDLIANMSHELRTPLNAILGFSETIREGIFGDLDNDRYHDYVGLIHEAGAHLLDIINDILDVSAIEAGKMELVEDVCDIADLVETSVRIITHRAKAGEVGLEVDCRPDAPKLWADERRIKQILLNLLSNAVKFTEPGGRVRVSYKLAEDGCPELSVEDTGIGMTPEELAQAMTQFGQVDSGLNRRHEGTGLGLPLAHGLAEMHGAEFIVTSTKGEGTLVRVVFPRNLIEDD